jgi:hypothetical protein
VDISTLDDIILKHGEPISIGAWLYRRRNDTLATRLRKITQKFRYITLGSFLPSKCRRSALKLDSTAYCHVLTESPLKNTFWSCHLSTNATHIYNIILKKSTCQYFKKTVLKDVFIVVSKWSETPFYKLNNPNI